MARNVQLDHDHKRGDSGAALVWDCGSALYDSYELTAFKRQLDAAVLACRSLSMPHLPAATPPPQAGKPAGRRRRLPALLRKLFSKVLRLPFPASARGARYGRYRTDGGYSHGNSATGSPWSGALRSIPEESASPEKGSPVDAGPSALRKTQSERLVGSKTASSVMQIEVVL